MTKKFVQGLSYYIMSEHILLFVMLEKLSNSTHTYSKFFQMISIESSRLFSILASTDSPVRTICQSMAYTCIHVLSIFFFFLSHDLFIFTIASFLTPLINGNTCFESTSIFYPNLIQFNESNYFLLNRSMIS